MTWLASGVVSHAVVAAVAVYLAHRGEIKSILQEVLMIVQDYRTRVTSK
jgi:hypothetical protein